MNGSFWIFTINQQVFALFGQALNEWHVEPFLGRYHRNVILQTNLGTYQTYDTWNQFLIKHCEISIFWPFQGRHQTNGIIWPFGNIHNINGLLNPSGFFQEVTIQIYLCWEKYTRQSYPPGGENCQEGKKYPGQNVPRGKFSLGNFFPGWGLGQGGGELQGGTSTYYTWFSPCCGVTTSMTTCMQQSPSPVYISLCMVWHLSIRAEKPMSKTFWQKSGLAGLNTMVDSAQTTVSFLSKCWTFLIQSTVVSPKCRNFVCSGSSTES